VNKTINYIDLGVHYGQEIDILLEQYIPYQDTHELNVYGIEANPLISDALIEKYSDYSDIVHIFNYAITDTDGEKVNLYLTPEIGLGSSLYPTKKNTTDQFVQAMSFKLSSFISKYIKNFNNSINILKLNIEGAELLVYKDLVENSLVDKFKIYCGHPSHDIEKVPELHDKRKEYYDIIDKQGFELEFFCADSMPNKEKCINIFKKINL